MAIKKDTAKKVSPPLGASGTDIFSGIITEEYNNELSDIKGIKIYDKMRRSDGTVRAAITAVQLPIRRANWFITTASQDKKDLEVRDFVERALFDEMTMTWADFLRQALLMLPFGVMVFEKVFEIKELDGVQYITWRKLAPRMPKTITAWQTKEGEPGIQQMTADGHSASIPMEKLLVFVNEIEGENWWGTSMLRAAYKHWYIKSNLERIDSVAHERQGLGIPFVKMPASYTADDVTKAKAILKNLRANEQGYLLEYEDLAVEFKDMKASSTRDPHKSISYHNREIVLSVLAQFLDLGSGGGGSRALSQDHSDLFLQSLEAIANSIKDVMNKYAIKELVDLNFDNVQYYPELEYNGISRVDTEKLSTAYQRLSQSGGLKPNEADDQYLRELLGLPEKEENEDDKDMDKMLGQLDILDVELAGLGEQEPEAIDLQTKEEMAEQDILDAQQFEEMVDDNLLLFATVTPDTKQKISDALKEYWSSRKKPDEATPQQKITTASANIDDAKRRIKELRTVIEGFKTRAKSITDRKAKSAFKAAVQAKIDEIKAMISAGTEGIKVERQRVTDAKKEERSKVKAEKTIERNIIKKDRLQQRIDKNNARITTLKAQLAKAKTDTQRDNINERIKNVQTQISDQKEEMNSIEASEYEAQSFIRRLDFAESNDFKSFRPLTFAEKKVNFSSIQSKMDALEKSLTEESRAVLTKAKDEYLKKLTPLVEKKDIAAIKDLDLKFQSEYATLLNKILKDTYTYAKSNASLEMGVKSAPSNPDVIKAINITSDTIASKQAEQVVSEAKTILADRMAKGANTASIVGAIDAALVKMIEKITRDTASVVIAGHINLGRRTVFDSNSSKIYALQRSEILDMHTCNFCLSMDERIIELNDPLGKIGTFHSNCRGIWVEILMDEENKPKISGVPNSIRDRIGDATNELIQPKAPIVKKDSSADKAINNGKAGK